MIRIVTDSTCEAPSDILNNPRVTVVPLSVMFGQTALRDGVDITREQFWARLPTSNPLPTTSQATPGDFAGPFQQFIAQGDEVVVVTISSKLSGTYDSAVTAHAQQPGAPIDVIDSRSTSVGLGLMVTEAVTMAEAGATRAEISARMLHMRDRVYIMFVLDTLEYLQRGGRIGKAQAFVGTLLKFKPILAIVDGEVTPITRLRSRAKALEAVSDLMLERVAARGPRVKLGVTQANAAGEARQVGENLLSRFQTASLWVSALGPVLGVHVGPGTIGVAVYGGD